MWLSSSRNLLSRYHASKANSPHSRCICQYLSKNIQKMFTVKIYTSPNDDTQKTDFLFKEHFHVSGHLIQTSICFLLPLLPEPVPGYLPLYEYSTHDQGQNQPRNKE